MPSKRKLPTLATLVKNTPRNIVKNSHGVMTHVVRAVKDTDDRGEHKRVVVRSKGKTIWRNVIIKMYGENPNIHESCWVWCSCEYFLYFLEVADTINACSSIINSNGRLPVIRNIENRPYLCKHLYAAVGAAVKTPISTRPMSFTERKALQKVGIPTKKARGPKKIKKVIKKSRRR